MDTAPRVSFGDFELDRRSGELLKGGVRLRLQEAPLKVLQALLDRPGDVVTRDELRRRLWPEDTFVDFDNGLNTAVNRLRSALGDSAEKPRFIETVGRRGYRFVASLPAPDASRQQARMETASTVPTRLAVLPFRQLKPDPDTEFLTFSLADAIASALSGLESVAVRSPIAVAGFAGSNAPDLAALAGKMGVTLVLTGTMLRSGNRVRVSTQLIEAPHGTLRWTTTAEAAVDDMFRVLDELVRRIAESLAKPLTVSDAQRLDRDVPGSGQAFELYLRANGLSRHANTWTQARDLYLECIRADPQYAPAWAKLGRAYRMIAKYASDSEPELPQLAEESIRRALAINPELSLAHYMYAQLEMETGRSHEALLRLLDRARERRADPQLFAGLVQACRYVGLLDASRAAAERARRLDPSVKTSVAYTSAAAGEYERAVDEARENDDPFEGVALAMLGRTAEAAARFTALRQRYGSNRTWSTFLDLFLASAHGERDQVVAHADALMRVPFADPEGIWYVAIMLARCGEFGRAVDALRRTVDAGFACAAALDREAAFRALDSDAAYGALRDMVQQRHERARRAFEAEGGIGLFA